MEGGGRGGKKHERNRNRNLPYWRNKAKQKLQAAQLKSCPLAERRPSSGHRHWRWGQDGPLHCPTDWGEGGGGGGGGGGAVHASLSAVTTKSTKRARRSRASPASKLQTAEESRVKMRHHTATSDQRLTEKSQVSLGMHTQKVCSICQSSLDAISKTKQKVKAEISKMQR